MKCPRCQQENATAQEFCGHCGSPVGGMVSSGSYGDLQAEIERLRRSLDEASEQQTATAEILHVISDSPTDLQAVLDAVAASAARLCDSVDAQIFRVDGMMLRIAASYGQIPKTTPAEARPMGRGSVNGRAVLDRRTIHVHDLAAESDTEFPEGKAYQKRFGHRTIVATPLLRQGTPIGAITIRRMEVRPFSAKEIKLLETFADQAVIAIENARLLNETKEALEQQTATSEILRVIASSPTDVQPVFDTILASATTLLGGFVASITRRMDDDVHMVAFTSMGESLDATVRQSYPVSIDSPNPHSVAIRRCEPHIIADADTQPDIPEPVRRMARARGWRSNLAVPLRRTGSAIGALGVSRRDARGFTPDEIALLQTFADQAVIAIENVRLFTELEAKNGDLTEALARQTATAEILRVISSSPTDVQPVFDSIVESAARLCQGLFGALVRFDGELVHFVAQHNFPRAALDEVRRIWPTRPSRVSGAGRAILDRAVVQIPDIERDPEYGLQRLSRTVGHRSSIYVPMLRDGLPIGVIVVARAEAGRFADNQVELLKTFADQAVIAIENVRLFNETKEALDRQTATADILRVIASSPTELQPVLDSIATNAALVCEAYDAVVFLREGDHVRYAAHYGPITITVQHATLSRDSVTEAAILDRQPVHVHDLLATEPPAFPLTAKAAREGGFRTCLSVPLLRENEAIGALAIRRREVQPFTTQQIDLLKTFADQAVIAIENVRLFTELQAKNRELTTALDQQTATSEILRVISRSQTELQPVFDAIVDSAARLCHADIAGLFRVEGGQLNEVSSRSRLDPNFQERMRRVFPRPLDDSTHMGCALLERRLIHVADLADPSAPPSAAQLQAFGFRAHLAVPMLRGGEPIGGLSMLRRTAGLFSDDQVQLLQTFADQAVIAIENVRLLTALQARTQELTRSVEQLTALGDVSRAVSSSLDLDIVLTTIVERAIQLSGTDGGTIFEYDESGEEFSARATLNADASQSALLRTTRLRRGEGAVGQMAVTREPFQISDIAAEGAYESRIRGAMLASGTHSVLAIPLLHEDRLVGGLVVTRRAPGAFTNEVVELLKTFATQSALAIQNARLFREIEQKSRELEAASRHKSEFLANMSHELRTPLNAIIGFSEVLSERMFGELNEKQDEYLKDIHASGQHLLSLINDILDLSKIEAGKMELELSDFDLPMTIDNALMLVRERAGRRSIALHTTVDERLGQVQADERKIRQVLLNLLSNAIKFTPEGGRIEVGAKPVNGSIEVSVSDTGVGIPPEDQEAVFEEFRQVGTADKKVEGTGLGLALSRKFIELHGGKIWVKSQAGAGSTFTFTIPVRRGE